MRLAAALAFLLLAAHPAAARPLDPPEAKAMQAAVDAYLRAIGRGDAERVVKAIPPRVRNVVAGQAGIEARKLDETLTEQTSAMLKAARFTGLAAAYEGVGAEDSVLADGTAVTWMLVPAGFTVTADAVRQRRDETLLVLHEGGEWYMMRIEGEPQRQLVAVAYPFLADVAIPPARVAAAD